MRIQTSIILLVMSIIGLLLLYSIRFTELEWTFILVFILASVDLLYKLFVSANKKYKASKRQYDRTAPWNLRTTDKRD